MFIERKAVIINNNLVESVFSIGVPEDIIDIDAYVLLKAKEAYDCKKSKGKITLVDTNVEVEEGYGVNKDNTFFERKKKSFNIAFFVPELGVKFITFEEYEDEKTLKNTLSLMYSDINEFFIIPDEDFEYIKSLPVEALDLSSPDIVITRN